MALRPTGWKPGVILCLDTVGYTVRTDDGDVSSYCPRDVREVV